MEIASCGIVALQKLRCYNGIMTNDSVRLLTNEQLLADVATAAGRERETTARLIVLLSEIDSRRLYLGEGYSSLFTFCTQRLTCPNTPRTDASRPRVRLAGSRSSSSC